LPGFPVFANEINHSFNFTGAPASLPSTSLLAVAHSSRSWWESDLWL